MTNNPKYSLHSEPEANSADVDFIVDAINDMNMTLMNDRNYSPLRLFLRDEDSKIVGGIVGDIWGGWLHITHLWIVDHLRRQRYGSRLLEAAENEARTKQCHSAFLETHSFQAPDFYRNHGYKEVGQLDNYPQGHQFFIMWKSLVD
jgi:ribosomal protein S18 acetylase RimI-like enzyme